MTLDDYLSRHKIPIGEFAGLAGISRQALHRYRTGARRPEWQIIDRITAATDGAVTPNDFMLGSPANDPSRPSLSKERTA